MNDLAPFSSFAIKETSVLKELRTKSAKLLVSVNGTDLNSPSCAQKTLHNNK